MIKITEQRNLLLYYLILINSLNGLSIRYLNELSRLILMNNRKIKNFYRGTIDENNEKRNLKVRLQNLMTCFFKY